MRIRVGCLLFTFSVVVQCRPASSILCEPDNPSLVKEFFLLSLRNTIPIHLGAEPGNKSVTIIRLSVIVSRSNEPNRDLPQWHRLTLPPRTLDKIQIYKSMLHPGIQISLWHFRWISRRLVHLIPQTKNQHVVDKNVNNNINKAIGMIPTLDTSRWRHI